MNTQLDHLEAPAEGATITDRIRYLITRMRKTQSQFAELIGVEAPNFSRILNGHVKFTDAMANRIVVN
ncbi:MAG: helix-turn-helix domain-containing protein, partial [Muribaculaceae bacterium]|nr:helix-turn-helix domain-containing protein [Muribaculaceae bacterium]